ncbi:MAG: hypothetical protein INF79_13350 [Roseomonas sp.]|nr:hypothetical protein [Roseomonas sp.]
MRFLWFALGRPHEMRGALGGRAIFLDIGAGKGGALARIDLPFEALEPGPILITL